jgi:hypothetical protein
LIAGGRGWDTINGRCCYATGNRAAAEIYDPSSSTFKLAGSMTAQRLYHTATLLLDGTTLMTGGSPSESRAELYVPSVLVPAQVVTSLQFDRPSVVQVSSYSAIFSGSNLSPQTFFDVRYTAPESNVSDVVLNWQRGGAAGHDVSAGIAAGNWTINGVRPHEIETDHTSTFFPVSATITVSP